MLRVPSLAPTSQWVPGLALISGGSGIVRSESVTRGWCRGALLWDVSVLLACNGCRGCAAEGSGGHLGGLQLREAVVCGRGQRGKLEEVKQPAWGPIIRACWNATSFL